MFIKINLRVDENLSCSNYSFEIKYIKWTQRGISDRSDIDSFF